VEKDRVAGLAFGTLLRRHRLAAGLSQEVLAERARMSVNGIGALERGDRQYPYRETVTLLARALSLVPAAEAELEAAAVRPRQQRALTPADAAAADGRDLATNLPSQRTILVGREIEIADIVGILQNSRLVTVTGAGGSAKPGRRWQSVTLSLRTRGPEYGLSSSRRCRDRSCRLRSREPSTSKSHRIVRCWRPCWRTSSRNRCCSFWTTAST